MMEYSSWVSRKAGMTYYRNGPQRTATEADLGTTDRQELQKRRREARETD